MKNSLKRLRGFAVHKRDAKNIQDHQPYGAQSDELNRAWQVMEDMRNCYDSLLSAAAAATNSAYEFSESLRELGACLLEKTASNDDEEIGRVLIMLGKQQLELQKIVDSYRSHIFQTITSPSESVLNELRTVEEMKRQCDEKRGAYEYMIKRQKEKGKSKRGGESFTYQQVQLAHDEYDSEASLFLFRLKSLKQGQSRTLLTQAARHHAAQLHFFRKALTSLETVDPHVMLIAKQQHIDCEMSKFEDDDGEGYDHDDADEDSYDAHSYDGELSFEYDHSGTNQDVVSTSRNSLEVDDLTFPQVASSEASKENVYTGSQSAPLFPEKKFDYSERLKQMRPSSTRKLHAHVLPTPLEAINSLKASGYSVHDDNMWHSSPLEKTKYGENLGAEKESSKPTSLRAQSSVLRERNNNNAEAESAQSLFPSANAQIKRQAFSGPLTKRPVSTASGPIFVDPRKMFSGPLLRDPMARPDPPYSSSSLKIPFESSLKICELHELPRPPVEGSTDTKSMRYQSHSAPSTVTNNKSSVASPLPRPHEIVGHSFSISTTTSETVVQGG